MLYRARVDAAITKMLLVFGDPARITRDLAPVDNCPVTLGMILGAPDHTKAILTLAEGGTLAEDIPLLATDGKTRWVRDSVSVTARSADAAEVIGYISEVTKEKEQQLHQQQRRPRRRLFLLLLLLPSSSSSSSSPPTPAPATRACQSPRETG